MVGNHNDGPVLEEPGTSEAGVLGGKADRQEKNLVIQPGRVWVEGGEGEQSSSGDDVVQAGERLEECPCGCYLASFYFQRGNLAETQGDIVIR